MKPKSNPFLRALFISRGLTQTAALSLGLALAWSMPSARASTWVGDTSQDWNTAANWDSDPANPTGNFIINTATAGVFPILGAAPAFGPVDVLIGDGGTNVGRLDHTTGSLSLAVVGANGNWFIAGRGATTAAGTYNLADTAVTGQANLTTFGQGTGNLTVGKFFVGGSYYAAGGTGTVNINTTGALNAQSTQNFSGQGNSTIVVGFGPGAGTMTVDSGIINSSGMVDIACGQNNTQAVQGTLSLGSGATFNCEGDFRTGFAGSAAAQATVNLKGGTLNVASTVKRWMIIGRWDFTNSTINIDSGNLNLNTNTDIRFAQSGNVGTNVINLNGGAITSYSDNMTTANGAGVLDLQLAGDAASNNSINLNGGTLAIREILTSNDSGISAVNFNGGTLKATGSTANFVNLGGASQTANILANGAVIDSNSYDVTIPQALLGVGGGGLTKTGAGSLTLSAANTYTGTTTVNGGTLVIGGSINSSSGITINGSGAKVTQANLSTLTPAVTLTQGTFESNGTVNSLTVANSASNTVNPGAGTAYSMIVDNGVTFQGAATVNLRANGATMEQFIEPSGNATMALVTPGDGATNGQVTVNVTNLGVWSGGTDYPLISYSTFSGVINDFALGSVPGLSPRQSASLVDTGSAIALHITGDSIRWTGGNNSDWTTAAVGTPYNWVLPSTMAGTEFLTGDVVLFDDTATNYSVNIAQNVTTGSVVFDNATQYDVSSTGGFGIAGGSVIKNNTGTVVLTTTNTTTGTVTINNGILQIGDGIATDGSIAASASVVNNASLVYKTTGSQTLTNPVSGTGTLTMSGTGVLTLGGANTFSGGGVALASGTLNVNHASALGSTTGGSLTISGGTLDNTSGSALTTTTAKDQNWTGGFSFAGTDDLNFNKGTVTLSGGGSHAVNIASGATLGVGKLISTDGTGLDLTGPGLLAITTTDGNFSNLTGPLNLAAGSKLRFNTGADAANTSDLVVTALTGTGTLENGGGVERWFFLNNTTDHVFDGVVQNGAAGNLGFNKDNTGSFQFTNVQSFTGRTTIRNGTMVASTLADTGVASSIGAGTQLYLGEGYGTQAGNGTLLYTGGNITINRSLNVSCTDGYSGVIDTGADLTFTGEVNADDTGGFIKRGSGTLTFSNAAATQRISNGGNGGADVYGLNIAQGKLALQNGTYAVTGEVVVGGQLQTGGNYTAGALDITNGGTINAANWFSIGRGNGTTGLASVVTVDSGTLNQTAAGSGLAMGYNAGVAGFSAAPALLVKGTGVVNVAGILNCGEEPGAVATINVQDTATLNLNNGTQANKSIGVRGTGTLTVTAGTVNGGNSGFVVGRDATGVGTVHLNGGVIDTGAIVGGTGSSTLNLNGGTLRANASSTTFLSGLTTANVDAGGVLIDTQSYNVTVQALVQGSGSGGLTKNGAGTLTLSGVNTYVGNTTVNAGTVALADNAGMKFVIVNGSSNKITGAGTATLDGDFTFDLSGVTPTPGNTWTIVDTTSKSFTTNFTVNGFTETAGVWSMTSGGYEWSFDESTGVLSVAAAPAGYSSWITGFGLPSGDQDPTDDPDNDGVDNLMEYVLGGNPNSSSTGIAPAGSKSGSNFVVTFTRNDLAVTGGDVSILLEYGNNLIGWTSVAVPTSNGTVDGVTFAIADGSPNDTVTATIPTSSAVKFFARVKAVK